MLSRMMKLHSVATKRPEDRMMKRFNLTYLQRIAIARRFILPLAEKRESHDRGRSWLAYGERQTVYASAYT